MYPTEPDPSPSGNPPPVSPPLRSEAEWPPVQEGQEGNTEPQAAPQFHSTEEPDPVVPVPTAKTDFTPGPAQDTPPPTPE